MIRTIRIKGREIVRTACTVRIRSGEKARMIRALRIRGKRMSGRVVPYDSSVQNTYTSQFLYESHKYFVQNMNIDEGRIGSLYA